MAFAGKIYPEFTHIEIDESGQVWLIQNHFQSDTVIEEMNASAHGFVIIDDEYDVYPEDEEDYFD
jgi:hypothetical protein